MTNVDEVNKRAVAIDDGCAANWVTTDYTRTLARALDEAQADLAAVRLVADGYRRECDSLKQQTHLPIFEFEGDHHPTFRQGAASSQHELETVVTVDRCKQLVALIVEARQSLAEANTAAVLETILLEIKQHDADHPDHGIGCACHDKHAGAVRRALYEAGLGDKSVANFVRVLGYIVRNP